MNLYDHIFGVVQFKMIAASPEQLLTRLNRAGIILYEVRMIDEITAQFIVKRNDMLSMTTIAEECGASLRQLRRKGFFWELLQIRKRPFLTAFLLFLLFLTAFLPTRILFVEIDGNCTLDSEIIREAAFSCGISFGTVRKNIRSEQFKNKMLSLLPELQWLGVNTEGCVARISVRERNGVSVDEHSDEFNCILAARDGVIRSLTVTQGNPMCKVGDTVEKGHVLIAGWTQLQDFVRMDRAEGEIFADTNRTVCAVTPAEYCSRREKRKIEMKYSILIGKKLINLFKYSGILGASCGRIYKIYHLTLPGGFQLPLGLIQYKEISYVPKMENMSDSDQFAWLHGYIENYLQSQMIAGSVIRSTKNEIFCDGVFCLNGEYLCCEMIGINGFKEYTNEDGKRD